MATGKSMMEERRVALNAASKYGALALSMIARFFMTPYLVHTVGKTHYGLQVLAYQLMLFLGLFATSMSASYYRYAAEHYARKDYDKMNATLAAGFVLALVSSSLFVIGGVVMAVYAPVLFNLEAELVGTARAVLLLTTLTAAVRIPLRVWIAPTYITQRFTIESMASAAHILTLVPLALFAFHAHRPSIILWVALDNGLQILFALLIKVPLCRKALPEMRPRLSLVRSWGQVRPLIRFGTLKVLGDLAYLLYFAVDSIIISKLSVLGVAMVTYYGIAQRWVPQLLAVLVAFVAVLVPLMTSDFALGNIGRMRSTYVRAVRYCFVLGLYPCIVLTLFAHPFVDLWMGGDFAAVASPVMQLLMVGFIPTIAGQVAVRVLMACDRLQRHVYVSLAGGVMNVVLGVYFVKVLGMGLMGIALSSVMMLLVSYGANTPLCACRELKLPARTLLREGYLRPLLGAVPLVLVGAGIRSAWVPSNLAVVLAQMALCGIPYAAGVWFFALTPEDRQRVRAALGGMRKMLPGARGGGSSGETQSMMTKDD